MDFMSRVCMYTSLMFDLHCGRVHKPKVCSYATLYVCLHNEWERVLIFYMFKGPFLSLLHCKLFLKELKKLYAKLLQTSLEVKYFKTY